MFSLLLLTPLALAAPHARQAQTCSNATYLSINNTGWTICPNNDYQIPSLSWPQQPSGQACAQLCASTQGCTVSVWDHIYNYCHLKGNPSSVSMVASTQYDAIKLSYSPVAGTPLTSCPWGMQTYTSNGTTFSTCPYSDYVGNSLSITWGINSRSACAAVCASSPTCTKGVWDRLYNACHIKDTSGSLTWQVSTQFETIYNRASAAASSTTSSAISSPSAVSTGSCPTTPTLVEAGGLGWQICNNTDYQIASLAIPGGIHNAQACAATCANTANCLVAVYDHNGQYCHIKGSPANNTLNAVASTQYDTIRQVYTPTQGTPITSCPWGAQNYTDTVSGATYTICPMTDFQGTSNVVAGGYTDPQSCARLCTVTAGCTQAVWDRTGNYCHIKAATGLSWVQSTQFYTIVQNSVIPRAAPSISNGVDVGAKSNSAAIYGSCGVTAQHIFLGTQDKLFLVDKSEADPIKLANGYSATNAAYSLSAGTCRGMTAVTNAFCSGGAVSASGKWYSGGGNPAQLNQNQGNGMNAIRSMTPCDDASCNWDETGTQMQATRWYPSSETAPDGSVVWFGGYNAQVFLPTDPNGYTATAEYAPSKGAPVSVPILGKGFPFSTYPFVNLLSDGRYMIVVNKLAAIWNPSNQVEQYLTPPPNGPRNYPAGGFHAMLPLTPANNFTETIMYCGGGINADYGNGACPPASTFTTPATATCDIISPLKAATWSTNSMPAPRLMGNFLILPDNRLVVVNGAQNGVQGWGCGGPDESMATTPANTIHMFDPSTNSWSAMASQSINRGYHSSATLLPDGSIVMAGSNPHTDITTYGAWPTEFRLEKYYPPYYASPRPDNTQLPTKYTYGASFTMTFSSANTANLAVLRLVRAGWSTHNNQLGQRSLELTKSVSGSTVTFTMPSNRNLFPPGSTLAFVVVNGVPGIGKMSMVGA